MWFLYQLPRLFMFLVFLFLSLMGAILLVFLASFYLILQMDLSNILLYCSDVLYCVISMRWFCFLCVEKSLLLFFWAVMSSLSAFHLAKVWNSRQTPNTSRFPSYRWRYFAAGFHNQRLGILQNISTDCLAYCLYRSFIFICT